MSENLTVQVLGEQAADAVFADAEVKTENSAIESASEADHISEGQNPLIMAEENEEYKRLEKEFREYRTKKVLSRIFGLTIGNPTVSEVKDELKRAALIKARIVVMPRLVETARKELPREIKVETLVNYPFALGTKKAVLYEIKAAIRAKADVGAGVNLSVFASGNRRPLDRELRTLKKISRKNVVSPVFCTAGLRSDQISKLASIVKGYKFENVKLVLDGEPCSVKSTADAVKIFYNVLGEQCRVEVAGRVTTAEEAETLFLAGADRIITTDYLALSRAKLDNVTV